MEIPELNMITDFEVLQNPSLFSRVFSVSGMGEFLQFHSFFKWGALILALVAALTALITGIQLSFLRFVKSLDSSIPPIQQFLDDFDSDSDDDDGSSSTTTSSDEQEYIRSASFKNLTDEDFSVAGSNSILRRLRSCGAGGGKGFSWSDFASGKSVVKLWDSLGLEFDFDDDSSDESVVSIWDLNRDQKLSSFATSSPAVVFSAASSSGSSNSDSVILSAYDKRMGGRVPVIDAEWLRRRRGMAVDVGLSGVEKVYVRDNVTGEVTVGDLRKIRSPLEDATESEGDTWWDADEFVDY